MLRQRHSTFCDYAGKEWISWAILTPTEEEGITKAQISKINQCAARLHTSVPSHTRDDLQTYSSPSGGYVSLNQAVGLLEQISLFSTKAFELATIHQLLKPSFTKL